MDLTTIAYTRTISLFEFTNIQDAYYVGLLGHSNRQSLLENLHIVHTRPYRRALVKIPTWRDAS
jgi:hypothetical protein